MTVVRNKSLGIRRKTAGINRKTAGQILKRLWIGTKDPV